MIFASCAVCSTRGEILDGTPVLEPLGWLVFDTVIDGAAWRVRVCNACTSKALGACEDNLAKMRAFLERLASRPS